MEINYFGYLYCTYFALPHLKQSRGQIGVIGSLSGELGLPFRSGYCASKFATKGSNSMIGVFNSLGFFESLRTEIPSEEVVITIVSPPSVNTPMRQHSLKTADNIEFNEDDSKKMSIDVKISLKFLT